MHSSFFSFPYRMRIQRIMARRYAALVDGRAATDRYRNGIVGGKEICTFETTAFTDVDLAREMSVVRIFVFRKSPFFCRFAEVGGQFGIVLGEPEKAFGVFTQTLGELVAPFPRRGPSRRMTRRTRAGSSFSHASPAARRVRRLLLAMGRASTCANRMRAPVGSICFALA